VKLNVAKEMLIIMNSSENLIQCNWRKYDTSVRRRNVKKLALQNFFAIQRLPVQAEAKNHGSITAYCLSRNNPKSLASI